MAKASFKIKKTGDLGKQLKKLSQPIDASTARVVGNTIIKEMKNLIAKGISPIKGGGLKARFPAYKDTDKYPAGRKPNRPVNLKLTGAFLRDLRLRLTKTKSGQAMTIGYFTADSAAKEQGHREGANRQRKRPTIPEGKRESFAQPIIRKIVKMFDKRVKRLIK